MASGNDRLVIRLSEDLIKSWDYVLGLCQEINNALAVGEEADQAYRQLVKALGETGLRENDLRRAIRSDHPYSREVDVAWTQLQDEWKLMGSP